VYQHCNLDNRWWLVAADTHSHTPNRGWRYDARNELSRLAQFHHASWAERHRLIAYRQALDSTHAHGAPPPVGIIPDPNNIYVYDSTGATGGHMRTYPRVGARDANTLEARQQSMNHPTPAGSGRRQYKARVLFVAMFFLGATLLCVSRPKELRASSVARRHFVTNPQCATARMLGSIKALVSSTDTMVGAHMRRFIPIPSMPADSVTAVTDTAICRLAAIAYGRSLSPQDTTSPRVVSVVRAGSSYYVVADSTQHSEFGAAFLFTSGLTGTAISKFVF